MTSFYLSKNGEQLGPWSEGEVLQRLKSKDLSWSDYLYDEAKKDWVVLMDHQHFAEHFKYAPTEAPSMGPTPATPATSASGQKDDKEWFVLKGDNRYGPFAYLEVIKMLQEKNLYEFDYIWNASMSGWKRVAEVEEFKPEKIRSLKNSDLPQVQEVFFRRRHARAKYGASLVVHNNRSVWRGEALEISAFGAGITVDSPTLEPGQTLFLHFKPGDGVPPFNALCAVVSKQSMEVSGSPAKVRYGVKFTSISQTVQKAIKTFTEKEKQGA